MTIEFRALSDVLGVEVVGLDLRAPYDRETQAKLYQAFLDHHLLLVRGQEISAEDEVRFAELFGPISYKGENMKHGGKIMHISNTREKGAFPTGPLLFHSDHVFFEQPLKGIALYGEEVPSTGGDTLFADAGQAWSNLPQRLKERIDGLKALNVYDYGVNSGSQRFTKDQITSAGPQAVHPVAWPHPDTGAPILLVNRMMTDHVIGLEPAESDALLEELYGYIEDSRVVYQHAWKLHDLVFWDNRILQHARTNFDPQEKRSLRRVPIGEGPAQLAA